MQEGRLKPYYLSYNLQLFAKEGQDGEKTEEPTAKKLEDARKKGQVMRSTEVVTAATLLVFFLMLKVFLWVLLETVLSAVFIRLWGASVIIPVNPLIQIWPERLSAVPCGISW